MRRSLILLFVSSLPSLAACGDCDVVPAWSVVPVELVDTLGNQVEIDALSIQRDGDEAGAKCPSETCPLNAPGRHVLRIETQGRTIEHSLDVPAAQACGRPARWRRAEVVVYEGPRCELEALTSVQGVLTDDEGEPPGFAGVVLEDSAGRTLASCDVEDGMYRCPLLHTETVAYVVSARIKWSVLKDTVVVPVEECELDSPLQLDFDLSTPDCAQVSELPPAVRVFPRRDGQRGPEVRVALTDDAQDQLTIRTIELPVARCSAFLGHESRGAVAIECRIQTLNLAKAQAQLRRDLTLSRAPLGDSAHQRQTFPVRSGSWPPAP